MATKPLTAVMASYISAIGSDTMGAPSGVLYAAGMQAADITLEEHQAIIRTLLNSGLCTQSHHVLQLTDNGRAVYARIEELIAKAAQ